MQSTLLNDSLYFTYPHRVTLHHKLHYRLFIPSQAHSHGIYILTCENIVLPIGMCAVHNNYIYCSRKKRTVRSYHMYTVHLYCTRITHIPKHEIQYEIGLAAWL